jgi:hypothetical protein
MLVLLFRKDTKKILTCFYQKILLVEGHILFHCMKPHFEYFRGITFFFFIYVNKSDIILGIKFYNNDFLVDTVRI